MTDEERIESAVARYGASAHAIQSGVAMEIEQGSQAATPKHLRVGLDLRASDAGALVGLLIAKGIFGEVEYLEAVADAAEREREAYERRISERIGGKVTLA